MANPKSPAHLTGAVSRLLDERQRHADALGRIDQILSGVADALGAATANGRAERPVTPAVAPQAAVPKRRGRPPGVRNAAHAPAPAAGANGRRSRGGYATTGEESILAFINQHRNPTTKEIRGHWTGEGRLGAADNVLSKLFREKKVRRTPLGKGIRGSRYTLA